MKRFLSTLLLSFACSLCFGVTYYVSANGNDNNTGTSTTSAWRTISKVNSRTLVAGDVVLFERGGTYRGNLTINQSGTSTSPITISAYGNGEMPTFLGSQQVTGWTIHQGNIWKTQLTSTQVIHLFYNGNLMTIARFPNTGWLRNDQGSTSQINDSELTQSAGFWTGATAVIRSSAWSYDTSRVLSSTVGSISIRPISYNLNNYSWGYFLRNKLSLLDVAGEWFYDRTTSTLYFFPPNGDPNTNLVEIVTTNQSGDASGVRTSWQRANIAIENLSFKHYGFAGVSTSGATNVTVRNCSFSYVDHGIRAYGNNQLFTGNTFNFCFRIAIESTSGAGYGIANSVVDNIIQNCAIFPGLGKSTWGYFGISTSGPGNIIARNRLTNIGYIGVVFDSDALVEYNFVDNACFILSDGSGIAFDNTDGAIIRYNIVVSTLGNTESCASNFTGCDPKGKGIYFGNLSNRNVLVTENTVAYCNGSGIWFDHTMASSGNTISNNTLFGNNLNQFGASDYSNYSGPAAVSPYAVAVYPNQTVTGNIFYCNSASQKSMYHINKWFSGVDFANFNQNKYVNPWDSVSIQVWNIPGGTILNYSLSQWRQVRQDDLQSTNSPYQPQSTSNDHILVYNNTLVSSTIALPSGMWSDLNGNTYQSSITLDAFRSKTLFRSAQQSAPTLAIKVFLQGPFNGTNMNDNLRSLNLIPLSDPYPSIGYVHINGGGAVTTSTTLSITGVNAIVDWVVVELRNPTTPSQRVYSTSALIQRDGDIVATDGVSTLALPVAAGQYHIAVKHRNHLSVMTATPVNLTSGTTLNFNTVETWGVGATTTIGTVRAMWAGDANFDGTLKYTGTGNDRDQILSRIGGVVPTNVVNGYFREDVNMSGATMYTGAGNDRDIVLQNVGGTVPTNTKTQQIP